MTPGIRVLIALAIVLLAGFTVLVFVASRTPGGSEFAVLVPVCVLIAILLAIPHAVVVDDTGIRQRRLLFADRKTAWAEIATVGRDASTGRTFVWSRDGKVAAVFSPVLVGRRRFEQEIRARAKNVLFELE